MAVRILNWSAPHDLCSRHPYNIEPPEAEFLFMDGFQLFLQNHQSEGEFST
jgi:hypothetical protein